MQAAVTTPEDLDAAKRVRDAMDMHAVAGAFGWVAFHLADGRPADHVAYPRWQDAVTHMHGDRDHYLYLEIQPGGMPLNEAVAVLRYARLIHSQGWRIPGPDFAGELTAMPAQKHDRRAMARQLITGRPLGDLRLPNGGYTNLPSERRIQHG